MSNISPDALGRLMDRHFAPLVLYARQWCPSPDDVVQEVLIRLAQQNDPPRDPAAWLYRSVKNAAISAGRSSTRRRQYETRAAEQQTNSFVVDVAAQLNAAEASRRLAELPIEERAVIVARVWGGLTFEQIAEAEGCSTSTAHRRYEAGLLKLRDALEAPCRKIH